MARYSFRLPDIGEGIAEAEIVAWHVRVGEWVAEDAQLADMMTDKATVEMESPVSGTVVSLAGEIGDLVPIGSTLAVIETDDAVPPNDAPPAPEHEARDDGFPDPAVAASVPTPEVPPVAATVAAATGSATGRDHVLASPAVRGRAKDLGIDLGQVRVPGTRVRHADLDAFLRYSSEEGYHVPGVSRARVDERIEVIGVRRKIAERMTASKRSIPHFTYVEEIDVTALEATRADLNASRGERPKLTVLPFLITAICRTVCDFPMINARYDDEAGVVTRYGAVHLGVATQTPAGLMVPVIRHAQDKNVWQLADEISRLSDAARTGNVKSTELSGATLTVTSLGPLGGLVTTPIINRPEVAIIGPNKIIERPVFAQEHQRGDEIRRAKLMNVSISCDHRVVDGWDAASYIQALKKLLETPVLLLAP